MMRHRSAFTLIEVLISIALLGIIMMGLFSVVSMMRDSNKQLLGHLKRAKSVTESTKVLYLDIIGSDGNLTIKKDEFARLCIEQTRNSLYGLSLAKVCWLVLKDKNTLVRVEGNGYSLPTRSEEKVEVDKVIQNIDLFDVYHQKDKVVVVMREKGKEPISFMVQGVTKPKPPKKKEQQKDNKRKSNRNKNKKQPNQQRRKPLKMPDGAGNPGTPGNPGTTKANII